MIDSSRLDSSMSPKGADPPRLREVEQAVACADT
jgi:hypothetical protein